RRHGSVVTGADQVGGANRREQHERERARFEPGKPALPVLPWPNPLQVVSSVEINGSRTAGQSLLQGGPAIQPLPCEPAALLASRPRARRERRAGPTQARDERRGHLPSGLSANAENRYHPR